MSPPNSTGRSDPARPSPPPSSTSTSASSKGSYVPPHLRGKVNANSTTSSTYSRGDNRQSQAPPPDSTLSTRSRSDGPQSRSDPTRPSQGTYVNPSRRSGFGMEESRASNFGGQAPPPSYRGAPSGWKDPSGRYVSAPERSTRSYQTNYNSSNFGSSNGSGSRSRISDTSILFISGDSFVGALSPAVGPRRDDVDADPSLGPQMEEAQRWKRVVIDKGKGASAKGLGNPASTMKQGPKVLSFALDAFPRHRDYFAKPRFFMLMYGNVDLNINYLFQLRTRPLEPASFTEDELSQLDGPFQAFTNYIPPAPEDETRAVHSSNETAGSALGPKKFVQKIVKAYTGFIERDIVNGPVGEMLRNLAAEAKSPHHRNGGQSKSRVLVAGALPPMVKDQHIFRIQAKYIEQHADGASKSPPRPRPARLATISSRPEELSLGPLSLRDKLDSPKSSTSSPTSTSNSRGPFENDLSNSLHSSQSSSPEDQVDHQARLAEQTFKGMLKQTPDICSLGTRVDMIDDFNTQLREFCERYPDILHYIEINDSMRQAQPDHLVDTTPNTTSPTSSLSPATSGSEADTEMMIKGMPIIKYYASSAEGDGANVHPTWERTYPLWLVKLREAGVDVDTFPQVDMEELEKKLAEYVEQKGGRLLTSKFRTTD